MKIIVYTCVYNSEKTLPETIESVLRQSFSSFEFHIEDNGSTDGTQAVIYDYAARDSRIVPHIREKNHTLTGEPAPVFSFTPPESEYFTNIDGDDWWEPDYLERLLGFAERFRLDIACTGTLMHDMATGAQGARQLPRPLVLEKRQFAQWLPYYHAFFRPIWGKLIRTKLVPKVRLAGTDSMYFYGADTFYCFQLLRHANRIGIDNSVLQHYRIAQRSVSSQYNSGRFETDVYLYQDAISFLSEFGPVSVQNRNFLQCVYSNAVIDTVGVIHNSGLSPAEKLREYRTIATNSVTLATYRECTDESAARSRTGLVKKTLEAGAALGQQSDEDMRITLQTLLPRCGQAVSSANVQMMLEDPALLRGLSEDDADAVVDNLLKRIECGQGGKRSTVSETIQALAVNQPLLCQIDDGVFLRKYAGIYQKVWQGERIDALEEMTGLLIDNKVSGGRETFLDLFISLSAVENQPQAFVFGKLQLAQLYLRQRRMDECRVLVDELEKMGVENDDLDVLKDELKSTQ